MGAPRFTPPTSGAGQDTGPTSPVTGPVASATDFGTDISCIPDLDPGFATVSGFDLLGQDLLKGLSTPKGSIWYAPDEGFDLLDWVGESIDETNPQAAFAVQIGVQAQAMRDERITAARASATWDGITTLTVTLTVATGLGPFTYVFAASAAGVQLANLEST